MLVSIPESPSSTPFKPPWRLQCNTFHLVVLLLLLRDKHVGCLRGR